MGISFNTLNKHYRQWFNWYAPQSWWIQMVYHLLIDLIEPGGEKNTNWTNTIQCYESKNLIHKFSMEFICIFYSVFNYYFFVASVSVCLAQQVYFRWDGIQNAAVNSNSYKMVWITCISKYVNTSSCCNLWHIWDNLWRGRYGTLPPLCKLCRILNIFDWYQCNQAAF